MKRRYANPIFAGMIGTLVILLTCTLFPTLLFGADAAWAIPTWDRPDRFFYPGPSFNLTHQALCLRFCDVVLQCGMPSLVFSCFASCLWAKWTDIGRQSALIWCAMQSFNITTCFLLSICLYLALIGSTPGFDMNYFAEATVLGTWWRFLNLIPAALFLAPSFFLLGFLILAFDRRYEIDYKRILKFIENREAERITSAQTDQRTLHVEEDNMQAVHRQLSAS